MLLPRQQRLIGRHRCHNRRLLNPFLMNSLLLLAITYCVCRAVELHLLSGTTQNRLRLLINNPVCTLPFSLIVPRCAIVAQSILALSPKSVSCDPPPPSWESHLPEYLGHPVTLLKCTRRWRLCLSIEVVLLLQRRLEEDLPSQLMILQSTCSAQSRREEQTECWIIDGNAVW